MTVALELATDRTLIRSAGRSVRHLRIRLLAPAAPATAARLPLDLALVLDRSGSMAGAKWPRACEAALQALGRLTPNDRVGLVVYDDHIDTLLPLTPVEGATRAAAESALARVQPRGSTNLSGGWLTGCDLIGEPDTGARLRRCFLLTDGLANRGIQEPAELATHAGALRGHGIVTSSFGIGDDYDQALLGPLADAGGGAFHDIEAPERIGPAIARELGDALEVVCRDTWVWIDGGPEVRIEVLGHWTHRTEGSARGLWVGDLISEQELDLLVALTFPAGEDRRDCPVEVRVQVDGATIASAWQAWTWAAHPDNDRQPRLLEVDRQVARHHADAARRAASLDNRRGDLERARHRLEKVARRIRGYAGTDPELLDLAERLSEEAERQHRRALSSREAKALYYETGTFSRGRLETGERRKRTQSPRT